MSNEDGSIETGETHLDDIEDGAGCTEIWEKLSELRDGPGTGPVEADD